MITIIDSNIFPLDPNKNAVFLLYELRQVDSSPIIYHNDYIS